MDSIAGKFSYFSVDNFSRVTLVQDDVILLLSPQLDTLFSTSLKSFRPSSVESSKSFRTLLFDQERSVIHFLDNTMTDIHGEIDLVNLDIQQPWLVCESFGGNSIWVFDAGSMRLIRLNENLDKVMITENLAAVFDSDQLPLRMIEANDRLFILVPSKGIAVFDVFGTFMNLIPCQAITFDVYLSYLIILTTENTLVARSITDGFADDIVFPIPSGTQQIKFTADRVYLLTDTGLLVGKYIQSEK